MWPADFAGRLESWNHLRDQVRNLSAEKTME
jgi:hypothetical protein